MRLGEREKESGVGIASETSMDVCLVVISVPCPILKLASLFSWCLVFRVQFSEFSISSRN